MLQNKTAVDNILYKNELITNKGIIKIVQQ